MMFVSFKASFEGFMHGCRPFISLDRCHLRSKYLGLLLSATALDGNNGIFLIAFAMVESECKATWAWFIVQLHIAFELELRKVVIISDMDMVCLLQLQNLLLPEAENIGYARCTLEVVQEELPWVAI